MRHLPHQGKRKPVLEPARVDAPVLADSPELTGATVREERTSRGESMERETGIEPATNGLEGRDSATELLPLGADAVFTTGGWRAKPARADLEPQGRKP